MKIRKYPFLFVLFAIVVLIIGSLHYQKKIAHTAKASSNLTKTSSSQKKKSDVPNSHQSDWDLVLINRQHPRNEMNPKVSDLDNIQIDSRIVTQTAAFLAAAQKISPEEHLISGYRSVDYQSQVYESYIENEMVGGEGAVNNTGKPISRTQAEANVETYSQPPKCSEHDTGLAIDMSTVDELNQCPPAIAAKVAAIAPEYGFVLRFTAAGEASTGVHPEDWHFRYVGVQNAQYMEKHHLTLEEYLKILPK